MVLSFGLLLSRWTLGWPEGDRYSQTMKLYRGYKQQPRFLVPKLASELTQLRTEREAVNTRLSNSQDIRDYTRVMGEEKFTRLVDLEQIAGPQFFTDDEGAAREFAGEKGFLVQLGIDEKIATAHCQPDVQMIVHGDKQNAITNFVFTGEELATHLDSWDIQLIEIEREKEHLRENSTPSSEIK